MFILSCSNSEISLLEVNLCYLYLILCLYLVEVLTLGNPNWNNLRKRKPFNHLWKISKTTLRWLKLYFVGFIKIKQVWFLFAQTKRNLAIHKFHLDCPLSLKVSLILLVIIKLNKNKFVWVASAVSSNF